MENGTCIDITLQDLLQIIPKKCRRIDAYRGLVSMHNKMDITLTINSQKTKEMIQNLKNGNLYSNRKEAKT